VKSIAQNVTRPTLDLNNKIYCFEEKGIQTIWVIYLFLKMPKEKNRIHGENSPNRVTLGVVVMITIFCDFSQFSAKKLAFFLNTKVMINFFQNLALF
jgi:hypothetical protein